MRLVITFNQKKAVILGGATLAVIILSISTFHLLSISDDASINVSPLQAKELIDTTPSLVIVDMRTTEEFSGGHIPGAINLPINELAGRVSELNPHHYLLVYCRTGNRSQQAVNILIEKGFAEIYHLVDGIVAWERAEFPTAAG